MPIPKWCDRKSIRTVKRNGARILICCPKGAWKKRGWGIGKAAPALAYRCVGGTRRLEVKHLGSPLSRGAKKERREHPWASAATARRIAADHLKENPRAYGAATRRK